MRANLTHHLKELEQANAPDVLKDLLLALRQHFNVCHLAYQRLSPDTISFTCATYPESWLQRYAGNGFQQIDPAIQACRVQIQPINWNALDWSAPEAIGLRREISLAQIGDQGISIPIHGPGGQMAAFSATSHANDRDWLKFTNNHGLDLVLCAYTFHRSVLEKIEAPKGSPIKPLSGREIDVLTYLAKGHSRGKVANILKISEHTLRAYIENARNKLGAANTLHAVSQALSLGLIPAELPADPLRPFSPLPIQAGE